MAGGTGRRALVRAPPATGVKTEALDAVQLAAARELGPHVDRRGFYLGGGAALALHLGHRRSVDLDYFLASEMGDPLLLASELRRGTPAFEITDTAPGTLHGHWSQVPVSFLEFRYPLLVPPLEWAEGACRVASLDDLAAMKLSAIIQRGHRKDFLDRIARWQRPESRGG